VQNFKILAFVIFLIFECTTVFAQKSEPVSFKNAVDQLSKLLQDHKSLDENLKDTSIREKSNEELPEITVKMEAFRLINKAISLMSIDAVSVYSGASIGTLQEMKFQFTSPFNNDDIRNGWDKFNKAFNIIGPALLTIGTICVGSNNIDSKNSGYISASIGGLGMLISSIGKIARGKTEMSDSTGAIRNVVNRATNIVDQLSVSRMAYDDVKLNLLLFNNAKAQAIARIEVIKEIASECEAFENTIMGQNMVFSKEDDEKLLKIIDNTLIQTSSLPLLSSFFEEYVIKIKNQTDLYAKQVTDPFLIEKLNEFKKEAETIDKDYKDKIVNQFLNNYPEYIYNLQTIRDRLKG